MKKLKYVLIDPKAFAEDSLDSSETLIGAVTQLADIDLEFLKGTACPSLRTAGVKCLPSEMLHDVRSAIARGSADVESLAAWRIAELRRAGVEATARVVWRDTPQGRRYGMEVVFPDGTVDDVLGAL